MMYAKVPFRHLELDLKRGDELPDDHPMVAARPDLFQATKPKPKGKGSQPKE